MPLSWTRLATCLIAASLAIACSSVEPSPTDDTLAPAASCSDGKRNGTETDVDCGGECDVCDVGGGCITGSDCADRVCLTGTCREAECTDGVTNGSESDVDCGGSDCEVCAVGSDCNTGPDCADGVCLDGTCREGTCTDGVTNGSESDVDCGGSDCDGCAQGEACATLADCATTACYDDVCERALTVSGTAVTGAPVLLFGERIRIDFAAEPVVTNYDGTPIVLPTNPDGNYAAGSFGSPPPDALELVINGVSMPDGLGTFSYQTIANDGYYGVLINFADATSNMSAFETVNAMSLNGQPVDVLVIER